MDYKELLQNLSVSTAVSGNEKSLTDYLCETFKPFCDEVIVDKFYNVIGIKKGYGNTGKKIMVTAHYDEIGMIVKSIDKNGFISVSAMGGLDSKILLAQEVLIHGKETIPGVIGAKPPHLLDLNERNKTKKIEDLYIDTGLSYDHLNQIISIGDVITFDVVGFELLNNRLSSKSMDNRSGVTVLVSAMELLSKVKHEMDVFFIATTQEEVGLRGAKIASYNIDPYAAVVVDACHGDIPSAPKDEIFSLDKGPAIAIGPNLHKNLSNKAVSIAKEKNIPYQTDVEAGDTGTEAWAVQISRLGIPTALISIPVRYMHTTIEVVSMQDIKNAGILVSELVRLSHFEMEESLCF